jgi:hypothetical protein
MYLAKPNGQSQGQGLCMKQIKVSLPDDDVATLEQAAQRTKLSLSAEIRERLKNSPANDSIRPDILRLEDEVRELIDLVEMQCGHRWSGHPTTARVLQLAINALLARYGAREGLKFGPGELPDVHQAAAALDDPGATAIGIEAVAHNKTDVIKQYRACLAIGPPSARSNAPQSRRAESYSLFPAEMKTCGTAFMWADDGEQALRIANGMASNVLEVTTTSDSDYPTYECDPMAPVYPTSPFPPL